jgi:hypothetical protein
LLNLVRLRYRDTPVFLEVTSVSTSFTFDGSLGVNGQAGLNSVADDFVGASAGIGFAERPTITYLPLQGEQFATRLLTPLRPRVLVLLANSGWAIDRVLGIGVQRLGPLVNAPSASGPTPSLAPQYRDFQRFIGALRTIQREHELSLTLVAQSETPDGGAGEDLLGITLPASVQDTPEYATVLELLGLDGAATNPDGSLTIVCSLRSGAVGHEHTGPGGPLPLVTRSLMSSMFFLSHAVAVDADDEEAGVVTTTLTTDGDPFDWNDLLVNTFRVQTSRERPDRLGVAAQTAIRHRGRWFWVADADLTSKSTMGLMQQLFALQAGDIQGSGPILTLPLSGN